MRRTTLPNERSPYAHEPAHAGTSEGERVPTAGSSAVAIAGALGLGAALMYFLDPDRGARRRKMVSDRVSHGAHVIEDGLAKAGRDLRNRASGAVATTRSRLSANEVDDVILAERVRAELGRVVSHPSAITVTCEHARVTLAGPVLAREAQRLLDRVAKVRGVHDVENRLELHESAEGIPALQGGVPRRGGEFELRQDNWTPAARLLTVTAGTAMAVSGSRMRGPLGTMLGLGGVALAARGATNTPFRRLIGASGGRRVVDIQKTITIVAPREVVFTFFTDYENWPTFMTHVREVRETSPGRQHWVVDGPAGTTIEWDAEITALVENELVSWKSVTGAAVRHSGTMRFDQNDDGSTRVHIQMSYNPPAGAAGHAIAVLLRADPKRQMDDDLARAKTTIETGIPPRDAAQQQARTP